MARVSCWILCGVLTLLNGCSGEVPSDFAELPSTPINLRLEYTPPTPSVMVTWDPPVFGGSTLQTYDIKWGDSGQLFNVATVSSATTRYLIPGLEYNTTYTVSVSASSFVGRGEAATQSITTPTGVVVEGAPKDLTATTLSTTSVRLSWSPPLSIPEQDVQNYEVVYSPQGMYTRVSKITRSTNIVIESLLPDTIYVFKVRANTAIQSGPYAMITQ